MTEDPFRDEVMKLLTSSAVQKLRVISLKDKSVNISQQITNSTLKRVLFTIKSVHLSGGTMKTLALFTLFVLFICTLNSATWTGALSTDWNTAGNWNPAGVPNNVTNALIPAGLTRYPVVNTDTAVCSDLQVNNGATLTITSSGYLNASSYSNILGSFIIYGGGAFQSYTLAWHEGSTYTHSGTGGLAYFYIRGHLYFNSGSNIQMTTCYVIFSGGANSIIESHDENSWINYLKVAKSSAGAYLAISQYATQPFTTAYLDINAGSILKCDYNKSFKVYGHMTDYNTVADYGLKLNAGTVYFTGNGQNVLINGPGSYFCNVVKASSVITFTTNLTHDMVINGSLTIQNGKFDLNGYNLVVGGNVNLSGGILTALGCTIGVGGNWSNTTTPGYFEEAGSRVIFNGSSHQYCNYNETFSTLEVNKSGGAFRIDNPDAVVNCTTYDWSAGAIDLLQGTLNISVLADNAIKGAWYLNSGGIINLNLAAGALLDLAGSLYIFGGNFNIYGGSTSYPSYWPYGGSAYVEMSGGVLDIKEQGIYVTDDYAPSWTFSENITGGTIKVARGVQIYSTYFTPVNGVLQMVGSVDAMIYVASGSYLANLHINKTSSRDEISLTQWQQDRNGIQHPLTRANTVNANSNLDINGYFWLQAGTFYAPAVMNVGWHWYCNNTTGNFMEGTGRVILDSGLNCDFSNNENFNILEINKAGSGSVNVTSDFTVTCNSYDWTAGTLKTTGGSFVAIDLDGVDDALMGTIIINGGSIHIYQDTSHFLDLRANLTITNNGELHLYGSSDSHFWPYGGNASITMNSGIIDAHSRGIQIPANNTLTTNITGGLIRTVGNFIADRTDFLPVNLTLEMYSSVDAQLFLLYLTPACMLNLVINKAARTEDQALPHSAQYTDRFGHSQSLTRTSLVSMVNDFYCNNVTLQSGKFDMMSYDIYSSGDISINNGILKVDSNAVLNMSNLKNLIVNYGGTLEAVGLETMPAKITCPSGHYSFSIESGGNFKADYCIFEKMNASGIQIKDGAYVEPENCFRSCTFQNGATGGTLLNFENNQFLSVFNAVFPANTWSGASNIRKTNNAGMVNFANATGGFSGEAFDDDSFDRIIWTAPNADNDLQIVKALWSNVNPIVGETVQLTLNYLNMSTSSCGPCYLDLYYNLSEPPGVYAGQQYVYLVSIPPSTPQEVTFYVTYNGSPITWSSWLQIDTDWFVPESNDLNNVYGPLYITWHPAYLPAIAELLIERITGTNLIRLDWNYSTPVTRFNIYRSTDPDFTPSPANRIAQITYPASEYAETAGAIKYFYIVTAELEPSARQENPSLLIENNLIDSQKLIPRRKQN